MLPDRTLPAAPICRSPVAREVDEPALEALAITR
jgi:hypothetical protein